MLLAADVQCEKSVTNIRHQDLFCRQYFIVYEIKNFSKNQKILVQNFRSPTVGFKA